MTRTPRDADGEPQKQSPALTHCSPSVMAAGNPSEREHLEALVGLVGPAQRDAVGARDSLHMSRESSGELLQRRGLGRQRGHVVERFEPFALFLQLGGLFRDPGLQVAVHRLQMFRHAVEAFRQRAEFVAGDALHPGAEIAALNALGRVLKLSDRLQHKPVTGVEQQRGAKNGQRHHRDLQQMQERSPTRHVRLDGGDERVDVRGERRGIGAQRLHRLRLRRNRPFAKP